MKQPPHDMNETLDMVSRLRRDIVPMIASLPPSQAKSLMENLHEASESLVEEVRGAYPKAIEAFEAQERESETMLVQAKQNVAEAKQKLAAMPAVDQIRQNLVPAAPELPAGLPHAFASEMQNRYAPAPPPIPPLDQPATAWQDWSLT